MRMTLEGRGFEFVSYFAYIMSKGTLESFDLSKGAHTFWEDEICVQNQVFPWVLYQFEDKIYVEAKVDGYRVIERGAEFSEDMEIFDGMYIEVMEKQGRKSYEIMLIHHRSIHFAHHYYYIENELFIGDSSDCEIRSNFPNSLLPEHAKIQKVGSRYVVSTLSQQADIYVNGRRYENQRLSVGDLIWCMGLSIVFLGEYIAVSSRGIVTLDDYIPLVADVLALPDEQTFERVPRVLVELERGVVDILGPNPKEVGSIPLHLTLGPAFAMALGMLVSVGFAIGNVTANGPVDGLITSGFSALSCFIGALLWPSVLKSNQKKELEKVNDRRQSKYMTYAEGKGRELEEKYNRNRKLWNDVLSPSPEQLVKMTAKLQMDSRLWERSLSDRDFLALRVGLGSHDFEVEVRVPSEFFDPNEDELSKHPQMLKNKFATLKDVPEVLCIPEEKCVGICGEYEKIWALCQAMIVETMALHHPEDVKTVFFFRDHEKEHFMWAKDLPSVWSDSQRMRFMASTRREAEIVLRHIVSRMEKRLTKETYLFFVSDRMLLPEIEITGSGTRIFYVFISEMLSDLPKECSGVIRCYNNNAGMYTHGTGESKYGKFSQDEMNDTLLLEFRKALLAVPYTPPSHGHMVRDSFLEEGSIELIDFAGQKMPKFGEEEEMALPEHLDVEAPGLIKPVMFAHQDLEKWDEPEEEWDEYEEYEEVDEYEEEFEEYEEESEEYEEESEEYEEILEEEPSVVSVSSVSEESEEDEWDEEWEEEEETKVWEPSGGKSESEVKSETEVKSEQGSEVAQVVEEAEEVAVSVKQTDFSQGIDENLVLEDEFEDAVASLAQMDVYVPPVDHEESSAALAQREVYVPPVDHEESSAALAQREVYVPPVDHEESSAALAQMEVYVPPVESDALSILEEKDRANSPVKLTGMRRFGLSSVVFDQGLFISGAHVEVVNNLMLTLAKFTRVDYVFSENVGGKCDCLCEKVYWTEKEVDRAIEEIREYVWSFPVEKCVIMIPSFHAFCSVVSRRGLERLTRVLRKHGSKVALITGDTVANLQDYADSEFFEVAVSQEQGIVTDVDMLSQLMPYLPEGMEFPELEEGQRDFLYYNGGQWNIFFM